MPDRPDGDVEVKDQIQWASYWFAVIAVCAGAIIFLFTLAVIATQFTAWQQVLKEHFGAIIGLPGAAAVAFAIVVFLRQTEGPVEFEGLGFKFKGAAGQVIMWIACFLAMAAAIKWTW